MYTFNDIKDYEMDKKNSIKNTRPIASGRISIKSAYLIIKILIVLSITISFMMKLINSNESSLIEFYMYSTIYILINILYSIKLKNVPICDTAIIAFGFLLRLLIGSTVSGIQISSCLYITIILGALFVSFAKRKNEFMFEKESRLVLKKYSLSFLHYASLLFMILTALSYSFWCFQHDNYIFYILTIPCIWAILTKYFLNISRKEQSDPIEIITSDKFLYCLIVLYVGVISYILYFA